MKYCTICKEKFDDTVSFCPTDGEVLEDDPSSLVNTVLDGQYQMEALLGKGGMGAVYQARHILLGDRVAIKVLPPEVRTNSEWLRRFRREGQAARRFRHPNAVTVYDLRTAADGTIYMVMEYVEGHTLDAELRKRGRFTPSDAVALLTPIMSVLDTAHSMGVVHRDLKPENIMVGKPGNDGAPVIKLLDLGIAKMREIAGVDTAGNTALTMAGQVLGTPYYMSPEQWGEIPRDENQEIDGRADIYSLGLVFYEMIAGKRCYSGATLHELRREHVSTTPRPLFEAVPGVSRRFSDTILRAVAKDRGDRQATAGQLAAELKASLDGSTDHFEGEMPPSIFAETVGIVRGRETEADVNAATLIELDSVVTGSPAPVPASATAPPGVPTAAQRRPAPPPAPTIATQAESLVSSVTVPYLGTPAVSTPAPKPSSKIGFVLLALGLVVVLIGGGIGAWLLLRNRQTTSTTASNTGAVNNTVAPAREVAKYWLELEPPTASEPAAKVAGLVPIASGQSLKIHFVFNDDGYVYLFGPGPNGNRPTAFLTTKPSAETGLTDNRASSGVDMSFPAGENWMTLDKSSGSENYSIIFSKTRLTDDFFNVPVTGEPLSASHVAQLNDFIAKYKGGGALTELDESNGSAPFVRIKSAPANSNNPLVFDIRIQHK